MWSHLSSRLFLHRFPQDIRWLSRNDAHTEPFALNTHHAAHDLKQIARQAMIERGLLPDFSAPALAEAAALHESAKANAADVRDLRSLLWCSIDNDNSRDLDQ